jgi:Protein of unknown function (DUF2911)
MKKKIFIGLAIFAALIVGFLFYANYRNRTLSPPGSTELSAGDLNIKVEYSRPSVRGREIFGADAEKVLLPYGKYWRLGANETTRITFSKDVTFNGQPIKAGAYRIYAIPGQDAFEIRLNSEIGWWGYSEPDYSKDILSTKVNVQKTESSVEQFTFRMTEADGGGINVMVEFADTRLVIPVVSQ